MMTAVVTGEIAKVALSSRGNCIRVRDPSAEWTVFELSYQNVRAVRVTVHGIELVAVCERDSNCLPALDQNSLNSGLGADLSASLFRGVADRI